MPTLFQTTKNGTPKHFHVVYMREDGFSECSLDQGHMHQVISQPETPALDDSGDVQIDPQTGQPVMIPASVYLGEIDGHTHFLDDLEQINRNPRKMEDSELIGQVVTLYKAARDYESDARKCAQEAWEFYRGIQWDQDTATTLEEADRAALVINYLESIVDFLVGVFRQNRTDWRWSPTEDGDSRVADILNVVTKNIANRARLPHTENRVFTDVVITGRGFFHVYLDRSETVKGRIKVAYLNWKDVYCGPHDSITGEDLEHVHKKRWYSRAAIKNMFPDKAEQIDFMFKIMESPRDIIESHDQYGSDIEVFANLLPGPEAPGTANYDLIDIARKEVAVIETWQKEYHSVDILVDPDPGEEGWAFNTSNTPKKIVAKMKTFQSLRLLRRMQKKFRVTKWAGAVVLSDDYSDAPYEDFDVVPVYAKKLGKHFWGKVESGKDPQRWVNKTASKLSDILNKADNYGYWFDDNTFDSDTDKNRAKQGIAQPGFFLKCTDTARPPHREDGTRFPTELASTWQMMLQALRGTMNVDPLAMGQTLGSRESGTAVQQKTHQTLTGNEFLYDNFSLAKSQVGRMVVSLVKQAYTPDRIMRIIENQARKEPVLIGGKPINAPGAVQPPQMTNPEGAPTQDQQEQVDMQEVQKLFQSADLLEYDVECGEGPYGPTARAANMRLFIELAATPVGQYLPPELFIHMMDIPEKEKILAAINRTAQEMRAQAQAKQQSEVMKTQIAAQSKTRNQ